MNPYSRSNISSFPRLSKPQINTRQILQIPRERNRRNITKLSDFSSKCTYLRVIIIQVHVTPYNKTLARQKHRVIIFSRDDDYHKAETHTHANKAFNHNMGGIRGGFRGCMVFFLLWFV